MQSRLPVVLAVALGIALTASAADEPAFGTHLLPPGIRGTLVIAGPGAISDAAANAFVAGARAGDADARLVLLTTTDHAGRDAESWSRRDIEIEIAIETVTDDTAASGENGSRGAGAARAIAGARGVWLGASPAELSAAYGGDALRAALASLLARNGVVGAAGTTAAFLADGWAGSKSESSTTTAGLSLLPGAFVLAPLLLDTNATATAARRDAHERFPGRYGLCLAKGSVIVVGGRRARVVGDGPVRVTLAATSVRPERTDRFRVDAVMDLIALSRAAVARSRAPFPAARPESPELAAGTLFIGGGGGLTGDMRRRFIEAAGGRDASIVVIPTAIGGRDATGVGRRDAGYLKQAGARRVRVIDAATPIEAEMPHFLDALRDAGGIWFTGGRQWRLVDSYLDTKAHELMRGVLARGGAVFGSSAGASIQAEYMVRGHPLGNQVMMAEGYERGLGFLPGVAIDQHFSQRNRGPDMTGLKRVFPQLVGIGIDESTIIVVRGHEMEVVGADHVRVYGDGTKSARRDDEEYELLKAGDRYDFRAGRPIDDGD